MATRLIPLALYCIIYNVTACIPSFGKRVNQFDSYNLVYINLDQLNRTNLIEFKFQGQHYQIHVEKNNQLSPIINHQTTNELIVRYSLPQQSCHYHGTVLNYDGKSAVALSLCDGKGITGLINAFGQEIYIYPFQYDFNAHNSTYNHNLIHKHLIYKSQNYLEYQPRKRRLQTPYNNGDNVVEIYTLADPSFVNHFKNTDGNNWYSAVYNYLSQVISQASIKYETVNWGSNIGDISLKWVALDIVESFTGIYSSLYCEPCSQGHINDASQRCMAINPGTCNYQDYLDVFVTWYIANKDVTDFDYAMIFTSNNIFGADSGYNGDVGYSFYTSMCDSNDKSGMLSVYSYFELPEVHALFAHELGHNLGAYHDTNGCSSSDPNNRWIMCSTVGQNTFSSYTIQSIEDGFSNNNGYTCLVRRNNPFESNYIDGPTQSPLPSLSPIISPTNAPNSIPCQHDTCYELKGFSIDIDGIYTIEGCHNNKGYYKSFNGKYLYWSGASLTNWHINSQLDDGNANAYCDENALAVCSSNSAWLIYNNGIVSAPAADNTLCSISTPTSSPIDITPTVTTQNPSKSPTNLPVIIPTNSPNITPTSSPIPCEHDTCYLLTDFSTSIDGTYTIEGCHNDKGYYKSSNGKYLYWSGASLTNWHINSQLDDGNANAYCDANTLDACASNNAWLIWDNGFVPAPAAHNIQCSISTPANTPSNSPTRSPIATKNPSKTASFSPTQSPSPSLSPTNAPNAIPCEYEECYLMTGFSTNIDGTYTIEGCHNNKGYYKSSNGYYLYWSGEYLTNWHINTELDDGNANSYCNADTLVICSTNNAWEIYDNGWVQLPAADTPIIKRTNTPTDSPTTNDPSASPNNEPTVQTFPIYTSGSSIKHPSVLFLCFLCVLGLSILNVNFCGV